MTEVCQSRQYRTTSCSKHLWYVD